MTSDQSLPTGGEEWLPDKRAWEVAPERVPVWENTGTWRVGPSPLSPCFAGQRHPMSSMMETMTTTRKAMWRSESSGLAVFPGNSFSPLDWVGGKRCGSPNSGPVTFTGFTNAGGLFGDHIWFSNQLSPFFSLPRPDNGTCWDWIGTRIAISSTSWAVGPRCQSQPLWSPYSFLASLQPRDF